MDVCYYMYIASGNIVFYLARVLLAALALLRFALGIYVLRLKVLLMVSLYDGL